MDNAEVEKLVNDYSGKRIKELLTIVNHPGDYREEAVISAEKILKKFGDINDIKNNPEFYIEKENKLLQEEEEKNRVELTDKDIKKIERRKRFIKLGIFLIVFGVIGLFLPLFGIQFAVFTSFGYIGQFISPVICMLTGMLIALLGDRLNK
jgi:hypothetical protein